MGALARIRGRIRELEGKEQCSGNVQPLRDISGDADMAMQQQLPPIIRVETTRPPQIGKFSGSPAEWPAFRDLFMAEVDRKDFEPVTKLRYLQEACVGKAAERLGPWQPTSDNYKHAWGEMMAAYDDDYHVVHDILGKLFAVKRQEEEGHTSLSTLVDALTVSQRQMQTICPDASTVADQFWIHVVKQRLPKGTLDSWERYRNKDGANTLPTSADLKRFLIIKAKGRREREYEETTGSESFKSTTETNNNRYRPYDYGRDRAKSYNDRARSYNDRAKSYNDRAKLASLRDKMYPNQRNQGAETGRFTQCIVPSCRLAHVVWKCSMFTQLPLSERRELVRRHRLCNICLSSGHLSFTCPRADAACSKCPEARFKHHVKLCPKTTIEEKRTVGTDKSDPDAAKK